MSAPPLIVGAGPAGIRAAVTLVAAGLRPVVVDEAPRSGGQIYRRPPVGDGRSAAALYGTEASKATRLHAEFAALGARIDYRPGTLIWNLAQGETGRGQADILSAGESRRLEYDGLILATGATDRVLPIPGWTLPGVFTLGGAQVALKAQGAAIGTRVAFLGSGPLLYLVAWQYMKAGVRVAAVLDTAPFAAKLHLLRGLPFAPRLVLNGVRLVAGLRLAGVPIHYGVDAVRIEGDEQVSGISWHEGLQQHRLECDGIGYGLGLRSETQLADIAGCRFAFDARDRAQLPERELSGRTSRRGVYLAGDGAGIAGADAAELAGERAALALIEDRGLPVDRAHAAALEVRLARVGRFRDVLAAAFPFPAHWAAALHDQTILCRCEEIRAGDAREAIARFDITDINRLKAVSRIGMGRCQGRVCGATAAELLAAETGQALEAVGRLRAQAPVKPVPLTLLDAAERREAAE